MSRLFLIGLNHKTAPVEVRERLALPASRLGHALGYVRGVPGIHETAIISTCNRVEIYAWGEENSLPELHRSLVSFHGPGGNSLESHLYTKTDEEAAAHLFRVASGLDSLVLGEAEILGQVKGALEASLEAGTAGAQLDELYRRAIACGKLARSSTGIARGAQSIGAAAVELARQIFGSLQGHTVLILGAGKMSGRVAQCLVSSGAHRVLVANRTRDRADELAETFNDAGAGAEAVSWDEFPSRLSQADIVISSTRAPHYVVTPEQVAPAVKGRRRSLLLIDIAVPRDIDPAVGRFEDVFLFDIDDLQGVVEQNRGLRATEVAQVERIVSQEVLGWSAWIRSRDAHPVMAGLSHYANQVRETEVEATLGKLSHLSPRDRALIEAMGKAIAQKLIHPPLRHLRHGGEGDADALRRAYQLDAPRSGSRDAGGPGSSGDDG